MIYKCIKPYKGIKVGTLWVAKSNHYMFKQVGEEDNYRYLLPHILEKYFVEVKTK